MKNNTKLGFKRSRKKFSKKLPNDHPLKKMFIKFF